MYKYIIKQNGYKIGEAKGKSQAYSAIKRIALLDQAENIKWVGEKCHTSNCGIYYMERADND